MIKNPRYGFWKKTFTRGDSDVEKVFENIARSCIGPSASAVIQQQQAV
jgi:CCR4-NOT transcription complex subunit 1